MAKTSIQLAAALLLGLSAVPCYAQEKPKVLAAEDLAAVRRQVTECWTVPKGIKEGLSVSVYIKLKPDGTLDGKPEIILGERKDEIPPELIHSAVDAVVKCQPFKLPESSYETWKELEIAFQPVPPEWTPVSLKCPAGNKPLEYEQILSGNGRKYRLSVWYKGNVATKATTAFAPAGSDTFKTVDSIDLLHPRNNSDRDSGARLLKTATAQRQIGCLGTPAERKKHFERLKSNAEKIAAQR